MRPAIRRLLALAAALALSLAAAPAPGAQASPAPEAVNAAIDRGVEYLLRSQNRDGSWGVDLNERNAPWHDLRDGPCALAIYTLLKCGLSTDHPSIRRGLAFLMESKPRHTYAAGIQLHVLGFLKDPALEKRMQELTKLLLELQVSGGWDYPTLGRPDLSNTQVAALGLRAAHAAGVQLPKGIWSDLVEDALRFQERPSEVPGAQELEKEKRRMAGFAYEAGGAPTASMTTAGLTILGIAAEDGDRIDGRLETRVAEARTLALNWLEHHYSIEGNPRGEAAWHFYYLYGLERVGALFGLDKIGTHAWYDEGAAQLLKEQRPDGGWRTDGRAVWPVAPMATANTCFALLFLRRATLTGETRMRETLHSAEGEDSAVWVRVDARQAWTLWITGFARAADAGEGAESPRVERVEWWIGGDLVQTLPGDPSRPWTDERFAYRFQPRTQEELEIECRVTALDADGMPHELRSRPIRVRGDYVLEPWMLDYARDAALDALESEKLQVSVSSEAEFHPALDALDGLQGSSWRAKEDDPEPWLRIELAKPVRLKELWISPAAASETLRGECVVFTTVELRLNGAKSAVTISLERDARLKTKFVLPKPTLVRELELRVVDPPREPGKCVGFAEIEGR